jgi:glycine hydroxymethyltransferase
MLRIADWIGSALEHRNDPAELAKIRAEVAVLAEQFPLYEYLRA